MAWFKRHTGGQTTVVFEQPHAKQVANQLRALRTTLIQNHPRARTIQVTSPNIREGKTFVAANLAVAFARIGQQTLIVDANFGAPTIHQIFTGAPSGGLVEALNNHNRNQPVATQYENLDMMPILTAQDSMGDQLAQPRFKQLLVSWSQQYDRVIIDSAALLNEPDAQIISTLVDATLLTLRVGRTKKQPVEDAQALLRVAQAQNLGWLAID